MSIEHASAACVNVYKMFQKLPNSDQGEESPAARSPEICAHIPLKFLSHMAYPFAF